LEFYLATHTDSSLRVLSSTLRPEEHELVTGEHVRAAIELLRRQFVHVVVDLSRGFSEVNLTAMEVAHNILIVCAPDRAGVRGVSETQRIARELLHFPADPLQYVLNHALPYAAVSAEQLEQALHMRLAATIPFGGDAVARAALEGHPVVSRFSSSETSKSVVALATRIDQQLAEARALGRPAQSDSRRVGWPRAY
jgi:pilus assembly protein CpaE